MKIAITSNGDDQHAVIDSRFGRAEYFMVYDQETGIWDCLSNIQSQEASHGAGIQAAQAVLETGAGVLITGHIGPKAFKVLNSGQISIYAADGTDSSVEDGLAAFLQGDLKVINAPNSLDVKK